MSRAVLGRLAGSRTGSAAEILHEQHERRGVVGEGLELGLPEVPVAGPRVFRLNEQGTNPDVLGGGDDTQHGVAQKSPSKSCSTMSFVDGKAAEHHHRDCTGRNALAGARWRVGEGHRSS